MCVSVTAYAAVAVLFSTGLGAAVKDTQLADVPTLLVAGKGDGIKGNRFLQCPKETPLANLQLTMLEKMGLPIEQFGDSNGELSAVTGV